VTTNLEEEARTSTSERRRLGQFFTTDDLADLILTFCLRDATDKVLDPSCGDGVFLLRAYQQKRLLNHRLSHEALLSTICGVELAELPARVAADRLAADAPSQTSPNVLQTDFFELRAGDGFPGDFDAIVGNPPYTRQEGITQIAPDVAVYKDRLINNALYLHGKKIAGLSRRSGLHAYFFVHGTKFLRLRGRFGFIVANSWLDVEYGRGLQEFFLQNYKIVAIIESKVERWFEQADVNTCIVILERCDDKQERNENLVSFASLKKPLSHFTENLPRTILDCTDFHEDDELRIYRKKQGELSETEWKWGKYIRAPKAYFSILEKNRDLLVQLRSVAEVRFGIKTGANEFFYLTPQDAERLKIEEEFLQPVIFSLKEVKGYRLDRSKLTNRIIVCHKRKAELENTYLLAHIKRGEQARYHERPTCASRGAGSWYMLASDWPYAPLIFPAKIGERMPVFLNNDVYEDKKLYGITPFKPADTKLLAALLNSTLSRFFVEFSARQLTGAQAIADIDVSVVESLSIINPERISASQRAHLMVAFDRLCQTKAESLFNEIAATPEDVSIENIKPERRAIDRIIMADILRLSDEEQLDVYRAVIDVIKSRLDKAANVTAATTAPRPRGAVCFPTTR
jgi:adenine-specific DNA methylase